MKKIMLHFFLLFALPNVPFSQQSKKAYGIPEFIDSAKFVKELSVDKSIHELYNQLKKKKDYVTYKYDFTISSKGVVTPGIYGDMKPLDDFIKNKFNRYRWQVLNEHVKKMNKYGTMDINIIPVKKLIQIQIFFSDGSTDQITHLQSSMNTTIKME